jgi:hypothetical protein
VRVFTGRLVNGRVRCLLDAVFGLAMFPIIIVLMLVILVLDRFEQSQVALCRRAVRSMGGLLLESVAGIFLGAPHAADRRSRQLAAQRELDKIDHD